MSSNQSSFQSGTSQTKVELPTVNDLAARLNLDPKTITNAQQGLNSISREYRENPTTVVSGIDWKELIRSLFSDLKIEDKSWENETDPAEIRELLLKAVSCAIMSQSVAITPEVNVLRLLLNESKDVLSKMTEISDKVTTVIEQGSIVREVPKVVLTPVQSPSVDQSSLLMSGIMTVGRYFKNDKGTTLEFTLKKLEELGKSKEALVRVALDKAKTYEEMVRSLMSVRGR